MRRLPATGYDRRIRSRLLSHVLSFAAGAAACALVMHVTQTSKGSPASRPGGPPPVGAGVVSPSPQAAPLPVATPTAQPAASAAATAAGDDPFAGVRKAVVTVIAKSPSRKDNATGTGFLVDPSGTLVTSYELVRRSVSQQVVLPGSKTPVGARVLRFDEKKNLALLRAEVTPPVPAVLLGDASPLRMGDAVFAAGSPGGPGFEMTLTRGIMSADRPREIDEVRLLQHDAAVNPANSGGPLLDQNGQVVGVNVGRIKGTTRISFAVPVEELRAFIGAGR